MHPIAKAVTHGHPKPSKRVLCGNVTANPLSAVVANCSEHSDQEPDESASCSHELSPERNVHYTSSHESSSSVERKGFGLKPIKQHSHKHSVSGERCGRGAVRINQCPPVAVVGQQVSNESKDWLRSSAAAEGSAHVRAVKANQHIQHASCTGTASPGDQ